MTRLAAALEIHTEVFKDEMLKVAQVFDFQDSIGGETLSDYVRRQVQKLRDEIAQLKQSK